MRCLEPWRLPTTALAIPHGFAASRSFAASPDPGGNLAALRLRSFSQLRGSAGNLAASRLRSFSQLRGFWRPRWKSSGFAAWQLLAASQPHPSFPMRVAMWARVLLLLSLLSCVMASPKKQTDPPTLHDMSEFDMDEVHRLMDDYIRDQANQLLSGSASGHFHHNFSKFFHCLEYMSTIKLLSSRTGRDGCTEQKRTAGSNGCRARSC